MILEVHSKIYFKFKSMLENQVKKQELISSEVRIEEAEWL